mgnify:CR=1 FL=1
MMEKNRCGVLPKDGAQPWKMPKKAADMGVDMIVLTGNPGVGVDNRAITKALADLNEAVGDRVILTAGKMHASGILSEAGEKILTKEDAETFIEAGADVLLLPAPGTVPGFTMEHAAELIKTAHEKGVLAMTTIGTSQEGADEETIRQIALMCKMAGADIHHIGDSGYMGMELPENITAYSVQSWKKAYLPQNGDVTCKMKDRMDDFRQKEM